MQTFVEKLKAFFRSPTVMMIEAIVLLLMVFIIAKAGVTAEGIEKMTLLFTALCGLLDGALTFVASIFDKQNKLTKKDGE